MMDEEDISIMSNGVDEMIDSFTQCRTITSMRYDRHLRMGNLDTSCERQDASVEAMNGTQSYFIRLISRTSDIIGNDCLRWLSSFECECLEECFLDAIVSTIITPGHWLVGFFERNIDICIFLERVKHVTDNSKKR